MTPLEKEILIGVLALREDLARRDPRTVDRETAATIRLAQQGVVVTCHAPWLRSDAAGRQAVSRCYVKLAAAGLLVRHGDAGKTFQLSLTTEGERLARELLAAIRVERRMVKAAAQAEAMTDAD